MSDTHSDTSDTSSEVCLPIPDFIPTITRKDGDVIIESAGKVKFRVHSIMLREASPVFATMLCVPQPSGSSWDDVVPTLPMLDESAEEIDFILQCIYTNTQALPAVDTTEKVGALLRVARKCDFSRVLGILSINLADLLKQGHDAFQIWILATQYNFEAPRQAAADQLIEHMSTGGSREGGLDTTYPFVIPVTGTQLIALKSIDAFEYACLLSKIRKARGVITNGPSAVTVADDPIPEPDTCTPIRMSFEDGDMILRSNDHEEFRVHRSVVARGSIWLSTQVMTLPDISLATPSIDVAEDGITIDWILRSIYPDASIPTIHTLTGVASMLKAASRLHASRASFILAARLMEMVSTEDPLLIWALAAGSGHLHDKVRIAAAKRILRDNIPVIRTDIEPSTILRSATAHDLASLLTRCESMIRKAAEILLGVEVLMKPCAGSVVLVNGHVELINCPPINFMPAFSEISAHLGPFNGNAFSAAALQLEMGRKNCVAHDCGQTKDWERRKVILSRRRAAVKSLLDGIS